jgi:F-type H+-transporting ATPase subunit delta
MNENSIAAPYAKAIVSLDNNDHDTALCSEFLNDLTRILSMPLISRFIAAVAVNETLKIDTICSILKTKNEQQINFLKLIFANKRISIIGAIAKTYENILNNDKNIQPVIIQSAFKLSDADLYNIKKVLDKKTGKNCIINLQINENLIGGAVIHIGDNIIDGSILGQLKQLSNKLTF